MPMEAGSDERERSGRKVPFRLALMATVLVGIVAAGAATMPSVAAGDKQTAAPHVHARNPATMGAELAQVRRATARFHRVEEAIAAGYQLGWVNGSGARIVAGCVAHPTAGAMGFHYFNAQLMADNAVTATEPEALVYAPTSEGGLELVAVEWVVRGPQSNPPGVTAAPSVLGMDMHILVPPPGPAFYLMHAWVWDDNPAGMFADWNPEVSCSS